MLNKIIFVNVKENLFKMQKKLFKILKKDLTFEKYIILI